MSITPRLRELISEVNYSTVDWYFRDIPGRQLTYNTGLFWDVGRQSRLIEYLMLGLPMPQIYLLGNEVLDGKQRLLTICDYLQDRLTLTKLVTVPELNNTTFSQLDVSIKRQFGLRLARVVQFKMGTPLVESYQDFA